MARSPRHPCEVLRQADGDDGGLASSPTNWIQMSAEGQTWNIRKYCCMMILVKNPPFFSRVGAESGANLSLGGVEIKMAE
jgi:hypothetical protein